MVDSKLHVSDVSLSTESDIKYCFGTCRQTPVWHPTFPLCEQYPQNDEYGIPARMQIYGHLVIQTDGSRPTLEPFKQWKEKKIY